MFVEFPNKLYEGNQYFVPKLFFDEMDTLNPEKNAACKFCDMALYLAYKDGEVVGRVAAIVNRIANENWNHKEVRFGWFDFIDDPEVSSALLERVAAFGRERGMERMAGPLGFTDFDPEGMLVDGYDQLCTMALTYNYPYYMKHMEALGFTKEIDWLEYKIIIPKEVPEKITRVANIVRERYGMKVRHITKNDVFKKGLGHEIFDLINVTYSHLYNFTILPYDVIDQYVDLYMGFLDLDLVTVIDDADGNLAGFGVTMPSITRALQKCGGKLLPTGMLRILNSMYFKHEPSMELLLVAVRPEHKNKGILALMFERMIPLANKYGFEYAETNAELESNVGMISAWSAFDKEQTKRRRVYGKDI